MKSLASMRIKKSTMYICTKIPTVAKCYYRNDNGGCIAPDYYRIACAGGNFRKKKKGVIEWRKRAKIGAPSVIKKARKSGRIPATL